MNTKILSYLAGVTAIGTIAGIVFNAFALGLFAIAVCAALLLIAATDYAPRRCYQQVLCPVSPRKEQLPYAA